MNEVDLVSIQEKLYEQLKSSGWGAVLKSFLMSEDMSKILAKLHEESQDGKKFTPRLKQVFRAFTECPYDKLKLVMMLQCPYQFIQGDVTVADGIAMSCGNTRKLQPSLLFVEKEIKDTLYPTTGYTAPSDLKVWSNQGVLMLNAALTTTIGKTDTHMQLWKPFTVFLLDMLHWHNGGLVYAFLGKKAQEYSSLAGDNCYKLFATHPAYAAHTHSETWDSDDLFRKINETLQRQSKEPVKW